MGVGPSAGAQPADLESVRRQALYTYYHGITAELAHERIGVEGVPALLRLLADPTFPRRDNVVAFLGYLGGGETTDGLLRLLSAPPASLAVPEEDRALLLLPQSLGHIASRGDPRALEALLEMTAPGSNGGALAVAARHSPQPATLRDDLLEMALRGLALAGDARASARLRSIAARRGAPAPRRWPRPALPAPPRTARACDRAAGRLGGAASPRQGPVGLPGRRRLRQHARHREEGPDLVRQPSRVPNPMTNAGSTTS